MPHDVFISYSSKDKNAADAVCAVLERNGIRCWIAPRDVLPGMVWGSAIVSAIQSVKVLVLVFSGAANTSPQIEREVERAISKGIPVVPFRIEDVKPSNALEYFISASHWLDAFTQPMERHLETLAKVVRHLIALKGDGGRGEIGPIEPGTAAAAAAPAAAERADELSSRNAPRRAGPSRWMLMGGLAAVLVICAALAATYVLATSRKPVILAANQPPPASAPSASAPATGDRAPQPASVQHAATSLTGRWSWSAICGNGRWQGLFDIGEVSGGRFTGKFAETAWYDVGTISDGMVDDTHVSFTRSSGSFVQKWKGELIERRMAGSVAADTYSCTWQAIKN